MDLKKIAGNFILDSDIESIEPYGNGHINSTFKVKLVNNENQYILQEINSSVFKNPNQIVQNHIYLQDYFNTETEIEIPHLIPTLENSFLFTDQKSKVWRMMNFIKDSYSIEVVESESQAFQAGRGFGWFLSQCAVIDSSMFYEAIQDFHSLTFRLNQLNDALKGNRAGRLQEIENTIEFYMEQIPELIEIEKLINSGEVPQRVVHNDTKINNLLFKNGNAIAVIDLDTVGPGTVLFDYGDALRTICNTAAEDEKDLNQVDFNESSFRHFTRGYLEKTKSVLNTKELEYLHLAPIYMTNIMGIRFLTDYLNGDIYYKIAYKKHNLIRSLVQKKLIEQMKCKIETMKQIINMYK